MDVILQSPICDLIGAQSALDPGDPMGLVWFKW